MQLTKLIYIPEKLKRFLVFIMFFSIIIVGTIKINIKFNEEVSKMGNPYGNSMELLSEETEVVNTDYLLKDKSPIKLYYSKAEGLRVRLENKNILLVINRDAVKELKSNLQKGLKTANFYIKESINEAIESLRAKGQ